jgi:hypothetical protein
MRIVVPAALVALALAGPAHAQSDLQKGFAGALRGCEEWVLNPASWSNGNASFVSTVGLGEKMGLVDHVDEAALPPPQLRAANHYWRINSTKGAGFILVVSDQLPMCHITGGGDTDMQPVVSSVLASNTFAGRWKLIKESSTGDMATSQYQSVEEPKFSIMISRAKKAGGRLDRVQVLATAMFNTGK